MEETIERDGYADRLVEECVQSLCHALRAALKRRSSAEAELAGALFVVAPHSEELCLEVKRATEVLLAREQLDRPLLRAGLRALARCKPETCSDLVQQAALVMAAPELLLAAPLATDAKSGAPPRAALASGRALPAFCVELARVRDGASDGRVLQALALRIKESDRVALIEQLADAGPFAEEFAPAWPALRILRDSERHLGRWLALAELGGEAGRRDSAALARRREREASRASTAGWRLVAWALTAEARELPPRVPNLEVLTRLGHRSNCPLPSFLFRLARAEPAYSRPRLEHLARARDPVAAALACAELARSGSSEAHAWLMKNACTRTATGLRALCAAALHDLGSEIEAPRQSRASRQLSPRTWWGLIGLAKLGRLERAVNERHVTHIEYGFQP